MKTFIDEHRKTFGVESICRVLQVASSMYWRRAARHRPPALRCRRAHPDEMLAGEIEQAWGANFRVYGAEKVWRQLNREACVWPLHRRGEVDATTRHARGCAGDGSQDHPTRSGPAVPSGPCQTPVHDKSAEPAVSRRLQLCLDLGGFCLVYVAFVLHGDTGTPVEEVCRKMGICQATFHAWRKKYGGLGVGELRKLRQLEEENRKLKQLVADLGMDKARLRTCWQKSSEALTKQAACASSAGSLSSQRTSGLRGGGSKPLWLTLSAQDQG